jgi:hypothetical protein
LTDSDISELRSLKQGRLLEANLREQIELYDRLETLEDEGSIPAEKLQQRLATLQQRKLDYLKYPFQQIKIQSGIELGITAQNGRPYRIPLQDLTKHLLTVGETGAGKTNLHYLMLDQLNQKGVPFLIFDLKQDYRHLLNRSAFEDQLTVIPWKEFAYNPLQPPPGVEIADWLRVFTDIFGHSQSLMSASKNYLFHQLWQQCRGRDEDEPPTLRDIHRSVENDSPDSYKQENYSDTVQNRLQRLTFSGSPMFQHETGIQLEKVLRRNTILELDGLGNDTQNLVIESLLAKIYHYRKARGERGNQLRHICLMDEGKQVFSAKKEANTKKDIPIIDQLTAKMREFGEGLLVADQEATKLTESIMANTSTKILLPTGSYTQFKRMADAIGLDNEQREWAQQELKTGRALVHNRGTGLAPVDVPLYGGGIEKNVEDATLEQLGI